MYVMSINLSRSLSHNRYQKYVPSRVSRAPSCRHTFHDVPSKRGLSLSWDVVFEIQPRLPFLRKLFYVQPSHLRSGSAQKSIALQNVHLLPIEYSLKVEVTLRGFLIALAAPAAFLHFLDTLQESFENLLAAASARAIQLGHIDLDCDKIWHFGQKFKLVMPCILHEIICSSM